MSFAARITRHPIAFDPGRGAEARGALPDLGPEIGALIDGAAGCSPYLGGLIGAEAAWLESALAGPEAAMAGLCQEASGTCGPEAGAVLRGLKRRAAVLIGLADLGGVWDLDAVTRALSDFADATVAGALRAALVPEARRGRLPPPERDAMVVLAMGKMGAWELNYSSDIDLICLFDQDAFAAEEEMEARAAYIRVTRRMTALLSEQTAEGYVFRTDLRLRPDAGVTPVCISMAAAERYYEAEGRTWERAAYIKARAAAGDVAAGARFLSVLEPFIWRRHLDFAAIHEIQDIRRRIRAHRGLHGAVSLPGHNIKLGAGGIREIEFFAQTRQLIAGGRDRGLRQTRTVDALAALAGRGWIGAEAAQTLSADYRALREVEHRLQMIADARTHELPQGEEGFDRLARFCGFGDTDAFRRDLSARLLRVEGLAEPFFAPGAKPAPVAEPGLSDAAAAIVARWPGYPALRSSRSQEIFARLRPAFLTRYAQADRPDEALANFDRFLSGLPAGVQLFSLFEANPALIDLIVDICAAAPGLARYLSRNAAVFDAVIGGDFFAPWPAQGALRASLAQALAGAADYEGQLDAARVWQKEWHFRIGVHFLRGLIDARVAGAEYAALAEAVVAALWPLAQREVARRHGPAPGAGGAVVAMGSLGAGALHAASDLDLIVIYDAQGAEASEGARPLDPRAWYAKATKTLIAALSAPTAAGSLYEADLRLRPSGRQGPVATGLSAFAAYQRDEAWTWEHLALTRARAIAGPRGVRVRIERCRREILAGAGDGAKVRADTAAMRARLAEAGRTGADGDVKAGPGGTQDIELLAQAGALIAGAPVRGTGAQLGQAQAQGLIDAEAQAQLARAYAVQMAYRAARALLAEPEGGSGAGAPGPLASMLGASDPDTLWARLTRERDAAGAIISAALPPPETT